MIGLPVFLDAMLQRDHMTEGLQRLYGIHERQYGADAHERTQQRDGTTPPDALQSFVDRLRSWGYRVTDPRPYHMESDAAIVAFQAFTMGNKAGGDLTDGDVMVAINGGLYRLRK